MDLLPRSALFWIPKYARKAASSRFSDSVLHFGNLPQEGIHRQD